VRSRLKLIDKQAYNASAHEPGSTGPPHDYHVKNYYVHCRGVITPVFYAYASVSGRGNRHNHFWRIDIYLCGSLQPSVFGSASISFPIAGFFHHKVMPPIVIRASHMPSPFPFLFQDSCQQLGEFGFFLYCLVRYMILPFDV